GRSVTRIAESWLVGLFHGNAPTLDAVPTIWELPAHPLSVSSSVDVWSAFSWYSFSSGSGSVPEAPKAASAGPDARARTVFDVDPPITNPAMRMLLPDPTWTRVETLTSRGEAGV